MAKILRLEKSQYINGLIPLRRGDDWVIEARVVDRIGTVDTKVDLTDAAVSGCFERDGSSDPIVIDADIDPGKDGLIKFAVPEGTSVLAALSEGLSMYATILDASESLYTVETQDAPLQIRDRGFEQF